MAVDTETVLQTGIMHNVAAIYHLGERALVHSEHKAWRDFTGQLLGEIDIREKLLTHFGALIDPKELPLSIFGGIVEEPITQQVAFANGEEEEHTFSVLGYKTQLHLPNSTVDVYIGARGRGLTPEETTQIGREFGITAVYKDPDGTVTEVWYGANNKEFSPQERIGTKPINKTLIDNWGEKIDSDLASLRANVALPYARRKVS